MSTEKPLHDDVPLDHAWLIGRRTYVRCPKGSQLDQELIALGARWDWDQRARWVGTPAKRDRVRELVTADQERHRISVEARQQVLDAGRWVLVPRKHRAAVFFERAGELGAVWDQARYGFALPSEESRAALQHELDAWVEQQRVEQERTEAEQAEQRRLEAQEQTRAAAEAQAAATARVIADSGRILTGDTVQQHEVSTAYMNTVTANSAACRIGTVRTLRDGRRGLIVGRKIWFTSEHDACDLDWHRDAPDQAHWNFRYTLEIVEPTAQEVRADAEAAAVRADALEIAAVFAELGRLGRHVEGRPARILDPERRASHRSASARWCSPPTAVWCGTTPASRTTMSPPRRSPPMSSWWRASAHCSLQAPAPAPSTTSSPTHTRSLVDLREIDIDGDVFELNEYAGVVAALLLQLAPQTTDLVSRKTLRDAMATALPWGGGQFRDKGHPASRAVQAAMGDLERLAAAHRLGQDRTATVAVLDRALLVRIAALWGRSGEAPRTPQR
ncbi:hypothetical protein [Nocardia sp. NRRL S-836]|uniref:hypothetical protein n=1 Tax=Nocardia sp. NRRL S-836 TaxID=1519492 RepID=UPI000A6E4880|nr:hypothetical protein [Nocardia sp. NRRL S-836]